MGRPKQEQPLVKKIAQAFKAVGKLPRAGTNTKRRYKCTRSSDVLEAVRLELLSRDVLIHISEAAPVYMPIASTNGGEQITECQLAVTYTFMDHMQELKPMTVNGVGRDVDDKALYKAQTGAQKALLKRFGLMTEDADEYDGDLDQQPAETLDEVAPMRNPEAKKKVTEPQISAFHEACANTGKTADEVSGYLLTTHRVSAVADLGRGRPFTDAIRWASNGAGTLAPKPQPAPAMQSKLPLPAPPIEMRIGNKTVTVEPQKGSYAL